MEISSKVNASTKRSSREREAIVENFKKSRAASNKHFKFPIYVHQQIMKESLDNLSLSVRSINCLRRVGMKTIGDLVDVIDDQDDLLRYRNLGNNSAKEIMNQLFEYQYASLTSEAQERYLDKVIEMNR